MMRIVVVGLGPIGAAVVRELATRGGFELVGGVDVDPEKAGRDLGEVCGLAEPLGLAVTDDLEGTLQRATADAAVVCTGSALEDVTPTLEACLAAGAAIVSSCEELAYPWRQRGELAERLDRTAREAGRAVLGTGVNPGFLMDALPLTLTAVCRSVESVTVRRVQDASRRRLPFQRKIGAGLSVEEFERRVAARRLGHVGLPESIGMIAAGLGWELEGIEETIAARLAEGELGSERLRVAAGEVCGLYQRGLGIVDGRPRIRLEFEARLDAPASYDEVRIEGEPAFTSRVEGGVPGDVATASVLVNCLPRVVAAPPGLITMKDLPPPAWRER